MNKYTFTLTLFGIYGVDVLCFWHLMRVYGERFDATRMKRFVYPPLCAILGVMIYYLGKKP